jgi:RNA polymerase sigma-70 factor (ECF subfamily)
MADRREQLGGGDQEHAREGDVKGRVAITGTNSSSGRLAGWFGLWRKPLRNWFSSRASIPATEIDDLAQEVFLRLLRYSDDIAVDNPQGYLFRIAANVANEWRDRSRVRRPHEHSWLDELRIEPSSEPENALAQDGANAWVRAAVEKLPPRQREVLLLHVNDGLTYKQIARQLGLTYRMVLRDLTKAYGQLRSELNVDDL